MLRPFRSRTDLQGTRRPETGSLRLRSRGVRRRGGRGVGLGLEVAALCLTLAGAARSQPLPSFVGVGDLPGGATTSEALAVSADGLVVVGSSEGSAGSEAFRWTPGSGLTGLGFLSTAEPHSEAIAVSSDGSVVVGNSHDGNGDRAFRWTAGSGLVQLGGFTCSGCDPITGATGVSADGLVVVGVGLAKSLFGDPHLDAARWPGGGTSIDDLGDLPGPADFNTARGASADGAVLVGEGDGSAGIEGWFWTSGSGMQALPGVPGAQLRTGAAAISSDGSTLVGLANTAASSTARLEAVRWTGPGYTTLELLGSLGSPSSQANAVSGDGRIVVGTGRNADNDRRAFVWEAETGMRDLSVVLAEDYGIDLGGWTLTEAHGVSDVGPDGELTLVGGGTNPAGEPEGWVARLHPPACRNGLDDDGDGLLDFPDDPQCVSATDLSEVDDCSDGIDNDGDGEIDHPDDPGCRAPDDGTERPDCSNGIDDDDDGLLDFPDDPGCPTADAPLEDPACDDGVDNDGNGHIDHPADPGCTTRADRSEGPDCSDGLDNDGDGDLDFPADADCSDPQDEAEAPECDDGIDNDGDGRVDAVEAFPACVSPDDPVEAPQCGDGIDDDGDGHVDFPADPECTSATDPTEAPNGFSAGDLLVLDRTSRTLFAVDPATGTQTRVTAVGHLQAPQGLALRSDGIPLVADPAGLVAIAPASGFQWLRSEPLESNESLQVVLDEHDDAFVLERSGISRVVWTGTGTGAAGGLGVKTTWLAVPTGEVIPTLGILIGDSLARESGGTLLTTGVGLPGDGVFRIDATPAASVLEPGFSSNVWLDLALESDGDILAVAEIAASGPGLYRIDPVDGASTPISVGAPWVRPVAVAVAPDGTLYVADAGSCSDGVCSDGQVAAVDPASGLRTTITSGGFVAGEMDLAVVVPEPGLGAALAVGMLGLAVLAGGRARARSASRSSSRCAP